MNMCLRAVAFTTIALTFFVPAFGNVDRLNPVHQAYPRPEISVDDDSREAPSTETLADAIVAAYAMNPALAASRYDLRATDDELGIALARLRPEAQLQIESGYDYTIPGDATQATRSPLDRLNDSNIERNDLVSRLTIDQPLFTGGRATSGIAAARAAIVAGRETLRGVEGDLLADLIAAYADVRRDMRALAIRERNSRTLAETLDEVVARREAGELTRTDIAQAETQMQAARVQLNAAQAQLESSRAMFTAIVGREPGRLAPEPDLPNLPATIEQAFAIAERSNPDLGAAIANENASRERIAVARAEGRPQLSVRGTAGTNGQAVPFERRDQDIAIAARATLTIPLSAGGRVRSLVAQARNRNSADALRIEATRRQIVQTLINAWNQWVTADRNVAAQSVQVDAARIYYEGTFEEYREGLRSTFDVLFSQNSLREAEISLLSSKRDSFVAQAVLLRQLGLLEAGRFIDGAPAYDPTRYTWKVETRSALPWDGAVRVLDRIAAPDAKTQRIETLPAAGPVGMAKSEMAPALDRDLATQGPQKPEQQSDPGLQL